jgi:hypothetical protein
MRYEIAYRAIVFVDIVDEFPVHKDIDHLAGAASVGRGVEGKHAISLVGKRPYVPVEVDDSGLEAVQDKQLPRGVGVPSVTLDSSIVKRET